MTEEELRNLVKEQLDSEITSGIANALDNDAMRNLVINSIKKKSILDANQTILLQCENLKQMILNLEKDYIDLLITITSRNMINSEKVNGYLDHAVDIKIKYNLIADTMLNNIKAHSVFLSKKSDVMPAVKNHFNGKKTGQNKYNGKDRIKEQVCETAKEIKSNRTEINDSQLAREVLARLKLKVTPITVKRWLKEAGII
ncbi:hypothetical protein [Testudinibacter aquarius]|uniref:Uncharacterized protein n=2 Tax=Testudinibacter aquarius TaxID=1524974 RepID=A0A4R3Y6L4_9PAST|nr:hypothetical protein [Testudinibacter aquarius]KAE9527916.1 hypothetical protein A1D24_01475 [Testudinibacter aquarius]TCV86518.1 hypothetical protein EDC16_10674 [Testudinibacter aquarius]